MTDNTFDQKIIDNCVRCGLCLATCPTYVVKGVETSSPRGRISILNAVNKGNLNLMDEGVVSQIYECLDCRACEAVCPSGVQYGKLVENAREQIEEKRALHYSMRVRLIRAIALRGLFFRRWLFVAFAFTMLLYQRSGLQWLARKSGILKLLRLAAMEEMLPHIDFPFVRPGQKGWQAQGKEKHKVALFAGCIMSTAFSGIDSATGRVLAKNGATVEVPKEQWCCGALHIHSGDTSGAQDLARRNIAAFEQSDTEYIIINAAGCGAALKEYDHLLHDDPEWSERAITFSRKVRDVSEYLAETGFTPPTANLDLEVTYQEPCHLAHAQRITSQPRRLLKAIPGLRLKEMEDSSLCCGSAGVYNLLNPTIANELVDRKLNNALATGAEALCTANPGCHIQLEAGLKRKKKSMKVRHIVQILDEAYRKEESQ